MNKYLIVIIAILVSLTACKQNKVTSETMGDGSEVQYFGEKINDDGVISYDQLLTLLETKESVENVTVKGKVDKVCQAKGCWMSIVSETSGKEGMFVKFEDYGFFMPLDLTGEVIMRGRAFKEETSVEELRHYAEDEGQSPEEIAKITESITELKFLADGVMVK